MYRIPACLATSLANQLFSKSMLLQLHACIQVYLHSLANQLYNYAHYCTHTYCILHGRIKGCSSSITAIMCQVGSYRTVVGSYRMVEQLQNGSTIDTFYQRKLFVYSINVLNFNDSITTPTLKTTSAHQRILQIKDSFIEQH